MKAIAKIEKKIDDGNGRNLLVPMIQETIDGHGEPVDQGPDWENLEASLRKFKLWGKDIIDDLGSKLAWLSAWQPQSIRDAQEGLKVVKKAVKYAEQVKSGWTLRLDQYRDWGKGRLCPNEYRDTLIELTDTVANRLRSLLEIHCQLTVEEGRFSGLVEGRW